MRIVGGRLRGRPIRAPGGRDVRPTSDRAREAVFNILANGVPAVELDGLVVLDVFAGTGALGLEALSRGAAFAAFVDADEAACKAIRANAAALGLARDTAVLRLDATRLGPPPRALPSPAGLAFLDPPYDLDGAVPALAGLARHRWLADGAAVVVETPARGADALQPPAGYAVLDERVYGAARVTFLRLAR